MHEVDEIEEAAGADPSSLADQGSTLGSLPWLDERLVPGVALIAAIVAGFSDGSPTGTDGWDWILKAAVAALFVAAVAVSPKWVAIVAATVAGAFLGSSLWLLPVGVALLLAIGATVLPPRHSWMSIVSAGLAVQGLLRFPAIGFFGLPSLVAGAVIALALVFGYRGASPFIQQISRRAILATAILTAIICGVGGLVLLSAKPDVDRGINAARGGLSAARDGDPEVVVAELETAAEALSSANDRASGLLSQPLRLVPIAAQHLEAVTTATQNGSSIARQASRATIEADISSITMSAGSVDLSALAAMEDDLVATADLLENGVRELDAARSSWLLSPIASRMQDLTDEMRDVLPEARVAADAAQVMPGLLGQDAPRRYFVAFGSPAESRELGGFVGSWALIEFDAGNVRQIDAGRINALYDLVRSNAPLSASDFPELYVDGARPGLWPQNIASSPQLSTVAEASRQLFDGLGGDAIDGFVYLDGYALGAMLQITGPVNLEGVSEQLNANNANDFFFDEQYRVTERDELKSELSEVFAGAFDGLLDTRLPGPERLGQILGPVARQGRLQVATFDEAENAFLQSVKLQREFGQPFDTADSIALVQATGSQAKLDLYVHRDVTYDVVVDDNGELAATVSVELTSDIPDDAPAYALGRDNPGLNLVHLSLYSRHPLAALRVDGESMGARVVTEFGYFRYRASVLLSPNTTQLVEYELAGQVDPERRYDLEVWHQPLVNNDLVHIAYQRGDADPITRTFELVETTTVSFDE